MSNAVSFSVKGNLVDILNKIIFPAKVEVENGIIKRITELNNENETEGFILP